MQVTSISCTQTMSTKAIIPKSSSTARTRHTCPTATRQTPITPHTSPTTLLSPLPPSIAPRRPPRRSASPFRPSPRSPCRTTSSSLATPEAVSICSLALSCRPRRLPGRSFRADPRFLGLQVPRDHTRRSSWSEMALLARSGSAIGMGRYRPIHPCPPCNAVLGRGPNMRARDWSPSRG